MCPTTKASDFSLLTDSLGGLSSTDGLTPIPLLTAPAWGPLVSNSPLNCRFLFPALCSKSLFESLLDISNLIYLNTKQHIQKIGIFIPCYLLHLKNNGTYIWPSVWLHAGMVIPPLFFKHLYLILQQTLGIHPESNHFSPPPPNHRLPPSSPLALLLQTPPTLSPQYSQKETLKHKKDHITHLL